MARLQAGQQAVDMDETIAGQRSIVGVASALPAIIHLLRVHRCHFGRL